MTKKAKKISLKEPFHLSVFGKLRAYFLTGLLITAPITLTFYLVWIFVSFIDNQVKPFIPSAYWPESYFPFSVPGLGLIIVIICLTIIGALTAGVFGRMLIRIGESIVSRMPIIRNIYGATKQVFEAVFARDSHSFRHVVMIEYPRRGVWALGFMTGITKGEVQNMTNDEVVNVFLPTTPNPTSGYLLFLPKQDIRILEMSVEEGIKMVVSAGLVTPNGEPNAKKKTPTIK